jgi:hypothetical protein
VELWDTIADDARRESALWERALLNGRAREREAVFSRVCDSTFALGLETIYEGYLCHYGRPRLFAIPDPELALLLGDYLYARGLVLIAATGNVRAVGELAELISLCSRLRAEHEEGDAEAWLAAAAALAVGPVDGAVADGALAAHHARLPR